MFHLQEFCILLKSETGNAVQCLPVFSLIQAGWLERIKVSEVVCGRKILTKFKGKFFHTVIHLAILCGSDRCTL